MAIASFVPQYKAFVSNDHIDVKFSRLVAKVFDQMSDSPQPDDIIEHDEFIVHVAGFKTTKTNRHEMVGTTPCVVTKTNVEHIGAFTARFSGKDLANRVWLAAKKGATYQQLQTMLADYIH